MTIGNGRRDSAATSYLAEKYLSRKNLFVVVNSRVTRVLPTSKNNPDEFKTVEVVSALDGRTAGMFYLLAYTLCPYTTADVATST